MAALPTPDDDRIDEPADRPNQQRDALRIVHSDGRQRSGDRRDVFDQHRRGEGSHGCGCGSAFLIAE